MLPIRPRETVILATDFSALVAWYRDVLGFSVVNLFEDGFQLPELTGFFHRTQAPVGTHHGQAS